MMDFNEFIDAVLPQASQEDIQANLDTLAREADAKARQNALDDPMASHSLTREEALGWASKYGLEDEVAYEMAHGCTPAEALAEWDIL